MNYELMAGHPHPIYIMGEGGMRASIYNAMPIEGVEKLVAFMKAFEEANA